MTKIKVHPSGTCTIGTKTEPYMSEEIMLNGPPEYKLEDLKGGDLEILNGVAWKDTKIGRRESRQKKKRKEIEGGFTLMS